ncbi:MAG: type II secretion system F family protein [Legionellaceae bacterium]|nr:type II secretion system F family protein [Legionellaceae bacterium]
MSHNIFIYTFSGINRLGESTTGKLFASSLYDARDILRRRDIIVTSLSKKNNWNYIRNNRAISPRDINIFTRQIATTLNVGIPFKQALDLICNNQSSSSLRWLMQSIQQDIESGLLLSESISKHPKLFNPFYCNLVAVGEGSGTLKIMLNRISEYLNNKEKTKKKIKKIITYPIILLIMAIMVSVCVLIFIIPQFETLFRTVNAELPLITTLLLYISKYTQNNLGYGVLVVTSISLIFRILYDFSYQFTIIVDTFLLKVPIVGNIIQKIILSRFTNALAVTYSSGMTMIESLKLVECLVGNKAYVKAVKILITKISEGEQLQFAMRTTRMFPDFVINMLSVGEESGSLDDMLRYVADYYDKAVENDIYKYSNLLEPTIMVILGIIIGGLVFAMYFPILKLGSVV